jgi:hypothetical protein
MTIKEVEIEIKRREKLIKIITDMINNDTILSEEQRQALVATRAFIGSDRNNLQETLDNTEIEIDKLTRLCIFNF